MNKIWIRNSVLCLMMVTMCVLSPNLSAWGQGDLQVSPEVGEKDKDQDKPAGSEQNQDSPKIDPVTHQITITATRVPTETFKVPQSVQVLNRKEIARTAAAGLTELLSTMPGLDVVGVGANQSRPAIRSFRGQRILLLDNGVRLNNSRRQQDFGEIPAQVDLNDLTQVEVVRGPSSVLYGSDAIGGVINMISGNDLQAEANNQIHGQVHYRYLSAGESHQGGARVSGKLGQMFFRLAGDLRKSGDYMSPTGQFGAIKLDEPVLVSGSGVKDRHLSLMAGWSFDTGHSLQLGYRLHGADDAGFGFVDPQSYGATGSRIEIEYPRQKNTMWRLDYENQRARLPFADSLFLNLYRSDNNRDMTMSVFVPISQRASITIDRSSNTDVLTWGGRFELRKQLFARHTLTYGLDFFLDETDGSTLTQTTLVGMGPVNVSQDPKPEMPNARYLSFGVFLQDEFDLWHNGTIIAGLRYQTVSAESLPTRYLEHVQTATFSKGTLVGALNYLHRVTRNVNLFASVARGFRSPNLIEQFFEGLTPDGGAYQSRNTNLVSETSLNVEFGLRLKTDRLQGEAGVFWNTLYDGIRTVPTGQIVERFPEYINVNVDRIGVSGFELAGRWQIWNGLFVEADLTKLNGRNLSNPEIPYTEHYDSKINLSCGFTDPKGLFWGQYRLRIQGDQNDVTLVDNPIGPYIPGFVVHSLGAGINLLQKSRVPLHLTVWVRNLTDALYCETANASFFRPSEGRRVVLSVSTEF